MAGLKLAAAAPRLLQLRVNSAPDTRPNILPFNARRYGAGTINVTAADGGSLNITVLRARAMLFHQAYAGSPYIGSVARHLHDPASTRAHTLVRQQGVLARGAHGAMEPIWTSAGGSGSLDTAHVIIEIMKRQWLMPPACLANGPEDTKAPLDPPDKRAGIE